MRYNFLNSECSDYSMLSYSSSLSIALLPSSTWWLQCGFDWSYLPNMGLSWVGAVTVEDKDSYEDCWNQSRTSLVTLSAIFLVIRSRRHENEVFIQRWEHVQSCCVCDLLGIGSLACFSRPCECPRMELAWSSPRASKCYGVPPVSICYISDSCVKLSLS